ncbi:4-carboxymuconolactone decarboxylase [Azospirillum baldaniorum]|uniref:carboxymuconolactone decarboxylase family protein n=1 Tax=Azospirillum baldaniorum TaxID=1064539 RepID=UPI0011A8598D|nr:carboxymuconolactone decarboxylase family protein [Azospirillum baldaniorum]TWA60612.1 4-carboxymuconolactone decarboxylase [Azospirillum baldaniorum]
MTARFDQGMRRLTELNGPAGEQVIQQLGQFAPDFARHLVEFIFGDIYTRPGLDLKTRQIVTISALAALGTAQPQLEIHLRGALRAGLTREEIIEIFTQIAAYAGFPAALNALAVARRIFEADPPAEGRALQGNQR